MLTNLISNAIKFTNEGTIAVRAMVEDDNGERAQLRISVQDTGIGLTDQDLRARCSVPSVRRTTPCRASPAAPASAWSSPSG